MRPSLLSVLLDAVRTNFNFQHKNIKLFELGKVFSKFFGEDNLPNERELFSLIITGNEMALKSFYSDSWIQFFDAKAALETAIDAINLPSLIMLLKT